VKIFDAAINAWPPDNRPTALALGYFDGVHLGHRSVIEAAAKTARQKGLCLAVFTFALGQKPGVEAALLQTEEQKQRVLAELGVKVCFSPPFEAFRRLGPRQFFDEVLVKICRARALFCGQDFAFGQNRAGGAALLRQMSAAENIEMQAVPTAVFEGQPISSTRIRAALAAGEMQKVNAMLGRSYEIAFPVVHGQHLGTGLGFPTINQVFPQGLRAPKVGVYITKTQVDGKEWPSATGYGSRPTVGGQNPTCETFIPGFSGDLYGTSPRVKFYEYMAAVQKFENPQALAGAVRGWAAQAVDYFEK
jgi:riboflavin kinase/FMN adenylyltransferase